MIVPSVDYHLHTVHCGHSDEAMTVANVIREAEAMGLEEIAFLEHVDSPEQKGLVARIRGEVERARPRLRVLVGAECALAQRWPPEPGFIPPDADFVGFSIHHHPTTQVPHWERPGFADDVRDRIYDAWFTAVRTVLVEHDVDLFCHPFFAMPIGGIILNYAGAFVESARPVLDVMAERGVAFELNGTMPLKNPEGMLLGYLDLVREAKRAGVKFSVGSVRCV